MQYPISVLKNLLLVIDPLIFGSTVTGNLSTIHDPELRRALRALFARQTFGIKLGLEPTLELLAAYGSPQEQLRVLHVAGTNGKGSTCAMLASVLTEAGFRTGLYASPHLVNFRERMRIDGQMIPEERLAHYAREMMPDIERIGCTFFEGTTAMALRFFAEEGVDVVVLETGMGGRLDATNVVTPLVSVITSIGLDHTRHLGETYELIAREKAGIIKPGVPAVVGRVRPRLRSVFSEVAGAVGTDICFVDDRCRAVPGTSGPDAVTATFMMGEREIPDLEIGLAGAHQVENAAVALTALSLLPDDMQVSEDALREGFRNVRRNAGIAGRFHRVRNHPDIILDVAHNGDGAKVLARTLKSSLDHPEKSVRFVYGAVQDKDVSNVMEIIAPLASHVYAVSADNPRSLPSDEVAFQADHAHIPVSDAGTVSAGVESALQGLGPDDTVVIFGSFFVVGEALEYLEQDAQPAPGVEDRTYGFEDAAENSPVLPSDITTTTTHRTMNTSPTGDRDERLPVADDAGVNLPNTSSHLSVKDWHPAEQPRERLVEYGPGALSDAELLAILLRTGTKGKDVVQVSRELLHAFGDNDSGDFLVDVVGRDLKELQNIDGIGPTKAITLAAAFELGNRVVARAFADRSAIKGPKDVARMFIPRMRALRKEQFHVVILNTAGQVIRTELVSEGTLNSSLVHPREVYRTAIIESAASIIGLHNHPSGNPEPSREDIAITKQLVDAGRILGIPFRDHIIIAGEEFVSLMDRGVV